MEPLDYRKLIEAGEKIVNDKQLGFAAEIMYPVQEFIIEDGTKYQLQVKMVVKVDDEKA